MSFLALNLFKVEGLLASKIYDVRNKLILDKYRNQPEKAISLFGLQLVGVVLGLLIILWIDISMIEWGSTAVKSEGYIQYALMKVFEVTGYLMFLTVPFILARDLKHSFDTYRKFKKELKSQNT